MRRVLPGVADVMAKPLRPVSMLMRLDLPTFERPMNAYSGMLCCGHLLMSVLLIMNSALFISISIGFMMQKYEILAESVNFAVL